MKTNREKIAVMESFEKGDKIEVQVRGGSAWCLIVDPSWDWMHCDYRIAPSAPKLKRVPLTPEDLPAVCWVRNTSKWGGQKSHALVTFVNETRFEADGVKFEWLKEMENLEYSPDRNTWKPMWKEVAE